MVTINIRNRDFLLFFLVVVFFVTIGYVIDYNSEDPAIMGHSLGEIQRCSAGQILKSNTEGNWVCSTDDVGSSTSSPPTGPVTGSVVGGFVRHDFNCHSHWGDTSGCTCGSGTTLRKTGSSSTGTGEYNYYFCIKN